MLGVIQFENSELMFEALRVGEIDIALDSGINGKFIINKLGLIKVKKIAELARHDLYLYLSKTDKMTDKIFTKIDSTIKDLTKNGKLEEIVKKAELQYLTK